jgi:predicted Zn-dependent peptidase
VGADVNAYTSDEETVYHVSGRKEDLPKFVELISDIVQNSIFPEDEIERERGVILQEYNSYQDDADSIVFDLQREVTYPGQSIGRKILGEPETINAFTRDDLMAYMHQYYTGVNTIVGVVGNYDEAELLQLVEQHFSAMPAGELTKHPEPTYVGGVAVVNDDFEQTQVVLGFPLRGMNDPAYYADALAASLLGDGMSSPLFTEVREKRGLVYSIGAFHDFMETAGNLYISAGTSPEHLDQLFNVVCEVLRKHTAEIDPIDFERARAQLLVYYQRLAERPFAYLKNFASDLMHEDRIVPLAEPIAAIQAVTVDDVKEAIKRIVASVPSLSMCGEGADEKYYDVVKAALR